MFNKPILQLLSCTLLSCCLPEADAQITERQLPKEWKQLAPGARFMDRFLPMPKGTLSRDTWGVNEVLPRYVDNGIEDRQNSYWGGNILKGEDGKYHLYVCGWPESSAKGHFEWPNSTVYHTVSDNPIGPFKIKETIGKGHNPEAYRLKDGRVIVYVINGYYISKGLDGPWEAKQFEFDPRDRPIIEGLSNLTFAKREDDSYLMVCRGGGIWISETGLTPYRQLTDKRVYPAVEGAFEDPVVWRDHVQYHLIVNDWYGRIAYYLRSPDGLHWVTDPGEAYVPGVSFHEDGKVEKWFKYERIKVFQDAHGRAIQANFAVVDVLKTDDKASDNHSSKNISVPLNPGLLLSLPDKERITEQTRKIRLKIQAEEGFDPQKDMDMDSLRFGASSEVNFGRGCKAVDTKKDGQDLIVTFDARGHGITEAEFAPKLIGKTKEGKLLYGYVRLPGENYTPALLSPRMPIFRQRDGQMTAETEVQNFGLTESKNSALVLDLREGGKTTQIGTVPLPALKPYAKTIVTFPCNHSFEKGKACDLEISLEEDGRKIPLYQFKTTPTP